MEEEQKQELTIVVSGYGLCFVGGPIRQYGKDVVPEIIFRDDVRNWCRWNIRGPELKFIRNPDNIGHRVEATFETLNDLTLFKLMWCG